MSLRSWRERIIARRDQSLDDVARELAEVPLISPFKYECGSIVTRRLFDVGRRWRWTRDCRRNPQSVNTDLVSALSRVSSKWAALSLTPESHGSDLAIFFRRDLQAASIFYRSLNSGDFIHRGYWRAARRVRLETCAGWDSTNTSPHRARTKLVGADAATAVGARPLEAALIDRERIA